MLDLDYRASSGYGRDWRPGIYRLMGGKDLEDVVDGVELARGRREGRPKRVGVYGGSYGGFITLMALFTSPTCSWPARRCVPSPTGRTTTTATRRTSSTAAGPTPRPSRQARRSTSPRASRTLLILHGMVDTNVFFQDFVRLAQRLIELRKEKKKKGTLPASRQAPQFRADLQCALVLQHPNHAETLGRALGGCLARPQRHPQCCPPPSAASSSGTKWRALGVRAIFAERQENVLTLRRGFSLSAGRSRGHHRRCRDDRRIHARDDGGRARGRRHSSGRRIDRRSQRRISVARCAVRSLVALSLPTYEPAACPLCVAGTPVTKPGSRAWRYLRLVIDNLLFVGLWSLGHTLQRDLELSNNQ